MAAKAKKEEVAELNWDPKKENECKIGSCKHPKAPGGICGVYSRILLKRDSQSREEKSQR